MLDNGKENSINFGDKSGFIVGFFAAVLALYPFKDWSDMKKINFLIFSTSVTTLVTIFLALLLLSTYFYALNYVRYDFPIFLRLKFLRHIETAAQYFYLFALLLYPIGLVTLYILAIILNLISGSFIHQISLTLPIIQVYRLYVLAAFFGFFITLIYFRRILSEKRDVLADELSEMELISSEEAKASFDEGLYTLTLLRLYNSIIKIIESKLIRYYGFNISKVPDFELINMASKIGLFTASDSIFISNLRKIRNEFAHSEAPSKILSKENLEDYIRKTDQIIKSLKAKNNWGTDALL